MDWRTIETALRFSKEYGPVLRAFGPVCKHMQDLTRLTSALRPAPVSRSNERPAWNPETDPNLPKPFREDVYRRMLKVARGIEGQFMTPKEHLAYSVYLQLAQRHYEDGRGLISPEAFWNAFCEAHQKRFGCQPNERSRPRILSKLKLSLLAPRRGRPPTKSTK